MQHSTASRFATDFSLRKASWQLECGLSDAPSSMEELANYFANFATYGSKTNLGDTFEFILLHLMVERRHPPATYLLNSRGPTWTVTYRFRKRRAERTGRVIFDIVRGVAAAGSGEKVYLVQWF